MKILIFYTYNRGVLSSFYQELSSKLSSDGFEVINYYLKHKKKIFIENDVKIYGDKRRGYLSNYYNIYKIISSIKPDVIITNFSYVNPALLFGFLLGVKYNIGWFHTVYDHQKPNRLKVLNKRLYLKLVNAVITNSSILLQEMYEIYGVSKEKLYCVPFWTNILNFKNSNTELYLKNDSKHFLVGCPGRLLEDKNHKVVIDTFFKIKNKQNLKIKLLIAGEGPYKKELLDYVNKLKLNNDIVFMGLLSTSEMVEFYNQMNLVVLPSLNEAFGLVFIEAISLGTPTIVSSRFGALSFVDSNKFQVDNFTFNPKSVDELEQKILTYINGQGLPPHYFKRLYTETFDKHKIYKMIKNIIIQKK